MPSSVDDIQPGDFYEDCAGHPCVCVSVRSPDDEDGISGISLIDGSYPRSCSLTECGVRRLSLKEAVLCKHKGQQNRPEDWMPLPNAKYVLSELQSLLSRLPGVSVDSTDISPNGYHVTLSITEPASVGPMAYCAAGANIPVELWSAAPQGQIEERENPKHFRYFLRSLVRDGGPEAALDRFAMFGNHLVWHLHATGVIPANEANRLLTLWSGKHVLD